VPEREKADLLHAGSLSLSGRLVIIELPANRTWCLLAVSSPDSDMLAMMPVQFTVRAR